MLHSTRSCVLLSKLLVVLLASNDNNSSMIWSLTAQFLLASEVTCMKLTYEQTIRHITRNFFLHLPHPKTSLLRYIYYYTMLWCSIFDTSRSLYFCADATWLLMVFCKCKSSSNISGRSN